jgi:carbon-monoxide dehydrogenase small subunit
MKNIFMQINGAPVKAEVAPRTHLADFLRGQQSLTGTHIGCEHGVCGACTVLIDGSPARSCITFAVACDGAQVTTLEGLENDPILIDLREAFSANHALQCGYCTPGMLISCRDIIIRLPHADESRIRRELSGNLCRCTGYVGIVAAVTAVLKSRSRSQSQSVTPRLKLGPVGAHSLAAGRIEKSVLRTKVNEAQLRSSHEAVKPELWQAVERDGVELVQSFQVPYLRDDVWRFFDNLDQVARCMPGARLTAPPDNGRAEGEVNVKLGPIVSAFAGVVEVQRDVKTYTGIVRGTGRDTKSNSNARAIISYELRSLAGSLTQVDISVKFLLTGALAQFGRSGIVKDVTDHLTRVFADNLEASLSGKSITGSEAKVLDAGAVARQAIWGRVRASFQKIIRLKRS